MGRAQRPAARRQGAWAIARPCLGALATAAPRALPLALAALRAPAALNAAAAVLMVSALGPMFHRLAIEPIPRASVLVYIIVTLGMHLILQGLALQLWGPQAHSVAPLLDGSLAIGAVVISHQSLLVLGLTVLLVVALYLGFNHTLAGTALRACAGNRTGADLCGIEVASAGRRAFGLGAGLAAVAGVLIAPWRGALRDGLPHRAQSFVGATLGGLVSYPAHRRRRADRRLRVGVPTEQRLPTPWCSCSSFHPALQTARHKRRESFMGIGARGLLSSRHWSRWCRSRRGFHASVLATMGIYACLACRW